MDYKLIKLEALMERESSFRQTDGPFKILSWFIEFVPSIKAKKKEKQRFVYFILVSYTGVSSWKVRSGAS